MNATTMQTTEETMAELAAYEASTIAVTIKEWDQEANLIIDRPYTVAQLRTVADRIFNSEDWKAPWVATVPFSEVSLVMKAVQFFHASEPIYVADDQEAQTLTLRGRGYQAW